MKPVALSTYFTRSNCDLIIAYGTNQVYRIEVRTLLEHFHFWQDRSCQLRAFEDLQGDSSVTVISKERTATRLTYILHHTAYTHRTVQFVLQVDHQFGIFEVLRFGILAEKLFLQELENFHDLLVRILSAVEQFEVFKCPFSARTQVRRQSDFL